MQIAQEDLSTATTDIHTHFGLSYANYLVLPRTLLQSMPETWQHQFVALLQQYDEAFAHVEQPDGYEVQAATEAYLDDLKPAALAALGWIVEHGEHETVYLSPDGDEIPSDEANGYRVAVPAVDPVPHYDRGRAVVEPRL